MGHALTIHLEDDAYSRLVHAGRTRGQSIETVASGLVDDSLADPLLSLSGCLEFSRPDVGERHDEYAGAAILSEQSDD